MFGCAPCDSGSGAADYLLLSEMRQMTSPESGGAGSGEDGGRGFGGDRRADPDDSAISASIISEACELL